MSTHNYNSLLVHDSPPKTCVAFVEMAITLSSLIFLALYDTNCEKRVIPNLMETSTYGREMLQYHYNNNDLIVENVLTCCSDIVGIE